MPTKRRRRSREARGNVHPVTVALLRGEDPVIERGDKAARHAWLSAYWLEPDGLRKAWATVGSAILAEWVEEHPGTRPSAWWRWSAPRQLGPTPGYDPHERLCVPRQRIGGRGDEKSKHLANAPLYSLGLPVEWMTESDFETYDRLGIDLRAGAIALDPRDPPTFESEACYLRRHGLLLPGELRRIPAGGWEPVAIALRDKR